MVKKKKFTGFFYLSGQDWFLWVAEKAVDQWTLGGYPGSMKLEVSKSCVVSVKRTVTEYFFFGISRPIKNNKPLFTTFIKIIELIGKLFRKSRFLQMA